MATKYNCEGGDAVNNMYSLSRSLSKNDNPAVAISFLNLFDLALYNQELLKSTTVFMTAYFLL